MSEAVSARRGYEVSILGWVPTSLNKLVGRHWSRVRKMKKADRDVLGLALLLHRVPAATGRRRVSLRIILAKGQRRFDADNVWKSLLDALVKCGALVNDSPKWVEAEPVVWDRGPTPATVLFLEEIGDERPGGGEALARPLPEVPDGSSPAGWPLVVRPAAPVRGLRRAAALRPARRPR